MNIKKGYESRVSELEDTHIWPFADFALFFRDALSLIVFPGSAHFLFLLRSIFTVVCFGPYLSR